MQRIGGFDEDASLFALFQHLRKLADQVRVQFLQPYGLAQPAGAVQVFRAEQAEELRMLQEIAPGEEGKFPNAFLRAARADVQGALGGADADIGFFEDAKIELLLVAEIM